MELLIGVFQLRRYQIYMSGAFHESRIRSALSPGCLRILTSKVWALQLSVICLLDGLKFKGWATLFSLCDPVPVAWRKKLTRVILSRSVGWFRKFPRTEGNRMEKSFRVDNQFLLREKKASLFAFFRGLLRVCWRMTFLFLLWVLEVGSPKMWRRVLSRF